MDDKTEVHAGQSEEQPLSGSASKASAVPILNIAGRINPAISCLILFDIDDEIRKALAFMSRIFRRFRFIKNRARPVLSAKSTIYCQ